MDNPHSLTLYVFTCNTTSLYLATYTQQDKKSLLSCQPMPGQRNVFKVQLEHSTCSEGFVLFSSMDQQNIIEPPTTAFNTTQDGKRYQVQQPGTYFIYQGQMHLIEQQTQPQPLSYLQAQMTAFLQHTGIVQDQFIQDIHLFSDTYYKHKSQLYSQSLLLSLDLDSTLVGDKHKQIQFNMIWLKFFWLSNQHTLIYNTARDIGGVEQALGKVNPFIWPEYMILQVGGYIVKMDSDSTYRIDREYTEQLIKDFEWKAINQALQEIPQIQSPLIKFYNEPVNFWMRLKKDKENNEEAIRQIEEIQQKHKENGHPFRLCYSGEKDTLDIDIMPIRGGKGQSMLYLIKNIIGHHDMVMSFGDAKTDIDMFMCSTVGVVQGNSQPTLKAWYQKQKEEKEEREERQGNGGKIIMSDYSFASAANHQLLLLLQGIKQ